MLQIVVVPLHNSLLKVSWYPNSTVESCYIMTINVDCRDLVAVAIRLDALLQNFVGGLCDTDLHHVEWEIFVGIPVEVFDGK